MKIIRTIKEMEEMRNKWLENKRTIGFVPTMGFFHEGHLTLMREAKKENDLVVTSIFVNPLQFGPSEDFATYPRDEERDRKLAEDVGVDVLFIPDQDEMYPRKMHINMGMAARTNVLCGKTRPGHFDGVITVLTKLFHIVQPKHAYFGLKDAQQVAVVDSLITDLNFPVQLIGLATVREEDGLAKSSRNVYLNDKERLQAAFLYKALQKGHRLAVDGERNPAMIVKEVREAIEQHTSAKIDYVELLSYPDLEPVETIDRNVILALAIFFDKARLIDNLLFDETGKRIETFQSKN